MSNWTLYAGIFCMCTGFLVPLGAILIGLYVYNDYTSKYKSPVEQVKQYDQNEYSSEVKDNYI